MPYMAFTDEWAHAWGDALSADAEYRRAAHAWHWPILITVQPDAQRNLPVSRSVYLDVQFGVCVQAREAQAADYESAPYHLTADLKTWEAVLRGELDPIMGIMRGKLRLERGSVASLLPYVAAARRMVFAATQVETTFP